LSSPQPIQIFVISLAGATQRRQHIISELGKSGVDFQLCDAVNGKELSDKEIQDTCDAEALKNHPTWLTRGAIGCALSHLNIYRKMISEHIPYAVVLEDDMVLPQEFGGHLKDIVGKLHADEVIMLYYQSWQPLELCQPGAEKYRETHGLYYPKDISQPITTGAYIITLNAAKRLAAGIIPIKRSADSWGDFHRANLLKSMRCVYPRLTEVAPFKSSIDYFRSGMLSKLMKFIDRVKLPVVYGYLRKRRAENLKSRQHVFISQAHPQWQK
jgi:glycosyl transferase family 25